MCALSHKKATSHSWEQNTKSFTHVPEDQRSDSGTWCSGHERSPSPNSHPRRQLGKSASIYKTVYSKFSSSRTVAMTAVPSAIRVISGPCLMQAVTCCAFWSSVVLVINVCLPRQVALDTVLPGPQTFFIFPCKYNPNHTLLSKYN